MKFPGNFYGAAQLLPISVKVAGMKMERESVFLILSPMGVIRSRGELIPAGFGTVLSYP